MCVVNCAVDGVDSGSVVVAKGVVRRNGCRSW